VYTPLPRDRGKISQTFTERFCVFIQKLVAPENDEISGHDKPEPEACRQISKICPSADGALLLVLLSRDDQSDVWLGSSRGIIVLRFHGFLIIVDNGMQEELHSATSEGRLTSLYLKALPASSQKFFGTR
jgi:hypothetical protein